MAATSDAVAIRELEGRLHRPERGENAYREGAEARTRIEALARLREFAEAGKIRREGRAGGINTHVHTSKSFSFFDSPSHAVWHAYLAQIVVFGINDHSTLAGHEEFGKACKAAGIRPAFSLGAVALWDEALKAGHAVNDPANPGRAYLTAKGVTRAFPPGSRGAEDLGRMNSALLERHSEMTARLASHLEKKLKAEGAMTWEGVLALTPHGAPTERHVALSAALFFERTYPKVEERARAVGKVTGSEPSPDELASPSAFQELLRAKLLKPGRPAHVKESKEAFLPLERMVSLALDLGAIPTYPVLGDPVTPWEEDLDELFDRLEAHRIHAIDVIPDRNGRERLSEIVSRAAVRGLPIFNGTEHNTKSPAPLVDRFFFDDEFRPHFERGARVLLGHQALCAAGKPGYVDGEGRVPPGDRESNLARVEEAGKRR